MSTICGEINECARKSKVLRKKDGLSTIALRPSLWAHLESNQAPTDYESVALTE